MKFKRFLNRINEYLDTPDVNLKQLKDVLKIFTDCLSPTEKRLYLYSLNDMIEGSKIQLSMDTWYRLIKIDALESKLRELKR